MQRFPRALTIFLRTSSETEYEKRLRGRGTEAEDVIQRRLANARNELKQAPEYRFQVVNDDLGQAIGEIVHIISSWEAKLHA
jgi:guanylate kinase